MKTITFAIVLTFCLSNLTWGQSTIRVFNGLGDGTSWNDSGNWSGNDVPDSFGEIAEIDAGGAFSVTETFDFGSNNVNLSGLAIGSDDQVSFEGINLTVGGSAFDNSGSLILDDHPTASSISAINFVGSSTNAGLIQSNGIIASINSTNVISNTGTLSGSFLLTGGNLNNSGTINLDETFLMSSGTSITNETNGEISGSGTIGTQIASFNPTILSHGDIIIGTVGSIGGISVQGGNLDQSGSGAMYFDINLPFDDDFFPNDQLFVEGDLTLSGEVHVDLNNQDFGTDGFVTLARADGVITLNAPNLLLSESAGQELELFVVNNSSGGQDLILGFQSVPEPCSLFLGALVFVTSLTRRKRI